MEQKKKIKYTDADWKKGNLVECECGHVLKYKPKYGGSVKANCPECGDEFFVDSLVMNDEGAYEIIIGGKDD